MSTLTKDEQNIRVKIDSARDRADLSLRRLDRIIALGFVWIFLACCVGAYLGIVL